MAPHKARLMMASVAGSNPIAPKIASAAVIGTTSATVIQSRPSMKLTRLTNQSPPRTRSKRSIQIGANGATRSSSGKAKITSATLNACSTKRGVTPIGRMSSAAPTAAMTITAARSGNNETGAEAAEADRKRAPAAAMMVAAITAMPPPCGVGSRCEERALGLASAMRCSHGRIATMIATAITAAKTKAAMAATASKLAAPWPMRSLTVKAVARCI